jgi:outer membrane biosynthesis protein TonB
MPLRPRLARWLPSSSSAAVMALAGVLAGCTSHGPEPLDLPSFEAAPRYAKTEAEASDPGPPSGLMASAIPRRQADGPSVQPLRPMIHGPANESVVRRIVRAHLGEVRECYARGLARDPTLHGQVTVLFVIDPRGKVPRSEVDDTSLPDARVAACVARAFRSWTFAKPDGGSTAAVLYSFVLAPRVGAS